KAPAQRLFDHDFPGVAREVFTRDRIQQLVRAGFSGDVECSAGRIDRDRYVIPLAGYHTLAAGEEMDVAVAVDPLDEELVVDAAGIVVAPDQDLKGWHRAVRLPGIVAEGLAVFAHHRLIS